MKFVTQSVESFRSADRVNLYATIVQIPDVSHYTELSRNSSGEVTVADPLHYSADVVASRFLFLAHGWRGTPTANKRFYQRAGQRNRVDG